MLNVLLLMNRMYENIKPNKYYFYGKDKIIEVTILFYMLNFLLVGLFIKNLIFENNLYCIRNNKLINYDDNIKDKILHTKIIKDIEYYDSNYKLNLNILKNELYKIHINVPLKFVLLFYKNIKLDKNSKIYINYYRNDTKILKVLSTTKFEELIN
tara:strand:- start:288 stop:752 length:465 start_codon:yes stop_codon:yes gene_type:complete